MPKVVGGKKDDDASKMGPLLHKVHPDSRRAHQKARKRERNLEKKNHKRDTAKRSHYIIELCAWVRMQIIQAEAESGEVRPVFTEAEAVKFYSTYLDQLFDEASAQATKDDDKLHRVVRTTDVLKAEEMRHIRETWLSAGLRLPDLTKKTPVENLKLWDGNPVHLGADILNDARAIEFKLFKPLS